MKKFVKLAKWAVFNVGLITLVYFAVIEKVAGAGNLLVTLVTLLVIPACLTLSPSVIDLSVKDKDAKIEPTVPSKLTMLIDVGISAFLIWHSWWYTGLAFLLASTLLVEALGSMNAAIEKKFVDALSKDYS